jgi:hypothetical protein
MLNMSDSNGTRAGPPLGLYPIKQGRGPNQQGYIFENKDTVLIDNDRSLYAQGPVYINKDVSLQSRTGPCMHKDRSISTRMSLYNQGPVLFKEDQ